MTSWPSISPRRAHLRLATLLLIVPLSATGQLTEPWQTDWDAFAREVAPLLRNSAIPAPGQAAFMTLPTYAGKEFEWTGNFFDLLSSSSALIAMKEFSVPLAANRVGALFTVVAVGRSASVFQGLRQNQSIRFRGRLDQTDNIAIIRLGDGTVTFSPWTVDVELVDNSTPVAPKATIELSSQGRTAGNGGTLSVSVPQGQRATVVLDGSKSTAGTGSITRYEWSGGGTSIGSSARIETTFPIGTTEIALRVTNSGAQTASATARIVVTAQAPPMPVPTLLTENPIVHGATFLPLISARTWVSIRGTNLATATRTWRDSDFRNGALPDSLDGTSVKMGGVAAYVYFISPTQLNVLSPDTLPAGPVTVEITTPQGRVSGTVQSAPAAPGLFTVDSKRLYPAATHPDGTLVGPPGLFGPSVQTRPLEPGSTGTFYGSGFGDTTPSLPAGLVVTSPATLSQRPAVFLGGNSVDVTYAGVVSSGLTQFNLLMPPVPPGDHFLEIQSGGGKTQGNIFVCMGGGPPSELRLGQSSLTFRTTGPAPAPQTVEVTTTGGSIAFLASATTASGGNWLTVDREGLAPRAAQISVNVTGLRPGTYRGTVAFNSCADLSGPKSVEVQLEIQELVKAN